MLAPRELPENFRAWNRRWNAPYSGAFRFEENNSTREFEYPWVFHEVSQIGTSLRILEVGGGLSGLQFVLAMQGYSVVNVDPGLAGTAPGGYRTVEPQQHGEICRALGTNVEAIPSTVGRVPLPPQSIDVIISVSALEHFGQDDLDEFSSSVPALLKPGGHVILTIDLFPNVVPFRRFRRKNKWGRNIDVERLLSDAQLRLVKGEPSELCGYPEFDAQRLKASLSRYLVGQPYPSLVQCLVAQLDHNRVMQTQL